jgi:hypothetical protein
MLCGCGLNMLRGCGLNMLCGCGLNDVMQLLLSTKLRIP